MGQKVSPIAFRLSVLKNWKSVWFSDTNYKENLINDLKLVKYFNKIEKEYSISKVKIERNRKNAVLSIYTSKPSFLIKKGGKGIETISEDLKKIANTNLAVNVRDVKSPDTDAKIVALSIATQIEKRMPYLRAVKKAIAATMKAGALGVKISISGRLSGAEIARSETYKQGSMSLHTIRSKVDYALSEAVTTYGVIGVKVWICRK